MEDITKNEITTLLTQDSYYRRLKRWPLLTSRDIFPLNKIRYTNEFSLNLTNNLKYNIHSNSTTQNCTLVKFQDAINDKFPYITKLLVKFKENLVACGGAVTKCISKNLGRCDIDLFFVNLTVEEADNVRIEAIKFIINSWKNDYTNLSFHIKRNEYTTTLYISLKDDEYVNDIYCDDIYEYQFIHRIYPDISSIIGGFDLSICMVAYDGNEIYATPLGSWSIKSQSIIIDTKRRSASFEYRLLKYYKSGYSILFPGISKDIVNSVFDKYKNEYQKMQNEILIEIRKVINKYEFDVSINQLNLDKGENFYIKQNRNIYYYQRKENILPYLKLFITSYYQQNSIVLPKNKLYDRNNIEDRYINKISDYSTIKSHPTHIKYMNGIQLRSDKLFAVCSVIEISNDISNLDNLILSDVEDPNIFIEDIITQYKNNVKIIKEPYINLYNDRDYPEEYNNNCDFHRVAKCFGKLTPEVMKVRHTDKYYEYQDIMIKKMLDNAETCKNNLRGIKWMTQDPDRQWTSSINPIIKDPRDWYGKHYIPVLTGIPQEIETCMRLMRLEKTNSVWITLNDDVFNLICMHLLKLYANDAWKYIL